MDAIIAHADELSKRFENYEPNAADELDSTAATALREAVSERSMAERHLLAAVKQALGAGLSWAAIGTFLGTSGEAARQKYSGKAA